MLLPWGGCCLGADGHSCLEKLEAWLELLPSPLGNAQFSLGPDKAAPAGAGIVLQFHVVP